MGWRKLSSEEADVFAQREGSPPGTHWFTSPCGVAIAVEDGSIELALMLMHKHHMVDALCKAVRRLQAPEANACALADISAAYSMPNRLRAVLETSAEATEYIARIPHANDSDCFGPRESIDRARELAQALAATRGAAVTTLSGSARSISETAPPIVPLNVALHQEIEAGTKVARPSTLKKARAALERIRVKKSARR